MGGQEVLVQDVSKWLFCRWVEIVRDPDLLIGEASFDLFAGISACLVVIKELILPFAGTQERRS